MQFSQRPIDVISVGELLIDLISTEYAEKIADISTFQRIQGGSPANMALNMARLGKKVSLVATIGKDGMGDFLMENVRKTGLNSSHIKRVDTPTTLILVTKSKQVSAFEAYRGADIEILEDQLSPDFLSQTKILHTTCFALSKNPARETILQAAKVAHKLDVQLSIDTNYAQKIWPDQAEAQATVEQFCRWGSLIKISDVDWERLYGSPLKDPKEAAKFLLQKGASMVCVTLGAEGVVVGYKKHSTLVPPYPVEVKDTTGAGDAFWSGFLSGWLDGLEPEACAKAGAKMAAIKLSCVGPLTFSVDTTAIYED